MVRVSIRIRKAASHFEVSVQAQSIRQAVSIVAARYPGADVRVRFPIDAEALFVDKPGARAEQLKREQPDEVAA